MREIKFRAWDKEKKRMMLPHEVATHFINEQEWFGENENLILMQYAGLKAKGKEIYEGDIVKVYNMAKTSSNYLTYFVSTIVFDNGTFGYTDILQNGALSVGFLGFKTPKGIEVIGNIYQNPELLK